VTQEERDSFEKLWNFFQQFAWHPAPSATIGEATGKRVADWMFDAEFLSRAELHPALVALAVLFFDQEPDPAEHDCEQQQHRKHGPACGRNPLPDERSGRRTAVRALEPPESPASRARIVIGIRTVIVGWRARHGPGVRGSYR
jgi:hypothetical protein